MDKYKATNEKGPSTKINLVRNKERRKKNCYKKEIVAYLKWIRTGIIVKSLLNRNAVVSRLNF